MFGRRDSTRRAFRLGGGRTVVAMFVAGTFLLLAANDSTGTEVLGLPAWDLSAAAETEPTSTSVAPTTTTSPPRASRSKPVVLPTDAVSVQRRMSRAIFDLANKERNDRGLKPLIWSDDLTGPAERWSASMAAADSLDHRDLEALSQGRNPDLSRLGENIMVGPISYSSSEIHVAWMNSPGHKANILKPEFDRLAVGVFCHNGQVWATQEFGTVSRGATEQEAVAPPVQTAPADVNLTCTTK